MTDEELERLRQLRPDPVHPDDPDPGVLTGERSKLMSTIEQTSADAWARHMPSIYPRIAYRDEAAALDFLQRAFGFRERREARMDADEKWGMLAWLDFGDGVLMICRTETEVHQIHSPEDTGGRNTCMINVAVDDIDTHYERAKAAGARIVMDINDAFYGYRRYEALDTEGHRFHFTEPLAQVRARRGEDPSG